MRTLQVIPTMPSTIRPYESRKEEMNALKGKVLQLRNRLGRQKRLRSLNEQSLVTGKSRAKKVERLLHEMEKDLKTLKGRLQDELNELGEPIVVLCIAYGLMVYPTSELTHSLKQESETPLQMWLLMQLKALTLQLERMKERQ